MGGKSKKPKTEIYHYYMAEHFGICMAPVDAMLAITVKEKEAWTGEETTANSFTIDKDQLFGGPAQEGGVQAVVYWLPGDDAQVLPDVLAQKLGRANGADAPGYRGIASAWFVGPLGTPFASYWDDHFQGKGGAYWTANSPYLPGVWIKVRRAPVGLNPDYALIPQNLTELPLIEGQTVDLTWWQTTYYHPTLQPVPDEARMGISYHDRDGVQIGPTEWANYTAPLTYSERTLSSTAPTGACIVRIYQDRLRHSGVENDGWIDDIALEINGIAIELVNPGAESGSGGVHPGWLTTIGGLLSSLVNPHSGARAFKGTGSHNVAYQEIIPAITGADANPAHIIYEALTNTDWGMGSPTAAFNTASFEAAGVTLYGEAFGLSLLWTRQASIQDFIQEVLDHINAVLFVDPSTGLLTMTLIRGDYDADTLDEITPDNAVLTNFARKLWGEIPNEIIVTWTNPETEQEETAPPAQDLASIANQGLITDSRNYYGVRNGPLAQRLAWRDLQASGQPLATFEAEVDRTQWQLRPASVIKATWPEHGLDGVVCRVTSVDYGRPGDPNIKLSLIEDVFGLDFGAYEDPPSSGWVDPSSPPEPLTIERIFTLPLFFAANSSVADFVDTPEYPEVVAGILGTTDQEDAYAFDLWDEVTLGNGSLQWQSLTSLNIIGHGELFGALVAEAASTGVTFDNVTGDNGPVVAGFVLIGDGEESENEIAMVDAVGATYDLVRGVLDTVPQAWPAGTPVWFIDDATPFEYPAVLAGGDTLDVKLLTRTSQGVLALGDAALVSHELTERPWLPNRPAGVVAYGVDFSSALSPINAIARPDPWVTVTWANRNRLLEDSQVLAWTDATVTPETDQTTTLTVLKTDGTTVLATHDGLTGTTFDVPDASFAAEFTVIIRATSERTDADGTFQSLQHFDHWVKVEETVSGAEASSGVGAFVGAGAGIATGALAASGVGAMDAHSNNFVTGALGASGVGALSGVGAKFAAGALAASGTGAAPLVGSSTATDPFFANTVLLLSCDGTNGSTTFTDESFAARGNATVTGDAQVSTSLKKFGTGSLRLDGTADDIKYADHADFTLSGDFTMEGWFSFDTTVLGSLQTLAAHYSTTSNQRGYWWRYRGDLATDTIELIGSSDGTATSTVITANWTPVADTFYFLVVERSGTTFRIYVDGVMLAKTTSAISLFNSTASFIIGETANSANPMKGNLDEFRLTLAARYNSDGGHAVPTAAHPRS